MHPNLQYTKRITSIDLLRGIIMIIMALDHVRDFFHISAQTADPLDLATTTPQLFFTRWITHFCAPVFVFLSGLSAFLYGRTKTNKELSNYLFSRGIWLVVVDIFIVSLGLTFDPGYHFVMLTVLWSIGWSMIILAMLLRISPQLIFPFGLILFLLHDYLGSLMLSNHIANNTYGILFKGLVILPISANHIVAFLYSILPWTGVMLLGYCFGKHVSNKKIVFRTGLLLLAFFLVLRVVNVYGDPRPWHTQSSIGFSILSFINTTKYPPALQFLCMTLGPVLILLPILEAIPSKLKQIFTTYGAVPFFYYVSHLFLAHLILALAFYLTGHGASEINDGKSPFLFRPVNFGFSLPVVYLVWLTVVVSLYYPCKWFKKYKSTHDFAWLKYL